MEWQDVLTRSEHVPAGVSVGDVLAALRVLAAAAHHQDIHYLWRPFLADPGDDMVLELAFASRSRYIVTHNVRHFGGSDKLGVKIVLPREFLRIISST